MRKQLDKRFWAALLIFGLMGQIAWVVENMYFNVYIYKMFHASAADISAMVMASAVTAAVTTIIMGAVSDRVGRRKAFMSAGYLIWGVTIIVFAYIKSVTLTIVMDCVMTFFGSTVFVGSNSGAPNNSTYFFFCSSLNRLYVSAFAWISFSVSAIDAWFTIQVSILPSGKNTFTEYWMYPAVLISAKCMIPFPILTSPFWVRNTYTLCPNSYNCFMFCPFIYGFLITFLRVL